MHVTISTIFCTTLPIRNADSTAALGIFAAEHAAAGVAETTCAVWLAWEALTPATEEAGTARLGTPRAIRHANAIAALVARATEYALAC